jgi:hypothetical protein
MATDRCCRLRADERQSRVAKHREVLVVGRLIDAFNEEICKFSALGGRLPNEHKIPVRPWTIRENGIIPE